ncbi:LPXTG cell wall anchor domain-containing protein [Ligilactobacillus saerimneri]|uniref:LPXTG cell wall anchor domain-containing protein n=2 Tax=Ligilactobacillus saerimneri TaxID=228229 RepID=UPI00041A2F56|nr:LPXTG cell wall anchor domain-containing protein [Ligilactobacillus saerimneri]
MPATNDDKQTLVNKTGVVPATNNNSGSTSINSADTTASDNVDKEATSTNNEETVPSTNNTNVGSSNSMDKSAPINDDKAVQPANNAKDTTETTSVVNPTSTDPTTSNNEEASTSLPWYSFSLVTTSNNEEALTSLPMSNQDIKLDSQPMLTEISNKPTDNWVYNNLKWYQDSSTAIVKEILQNHTANDESGRYYFAGVANYNEHYHAIHLLARSNNLNDNSLYVTILHTGKKTIQEAVVAPGESKKVEYSGTTHTPIFTNYDGTSASIDLDGIEKGDNIYGMVVGFAYGHNTGIKGDPASMGNGFVMTPIPTKMTTTIHYIDQATGDEIAVPKSFEGVAYQKYTITGEAPTIDGYTLKKSPETTGYISPYKVGESYDFRLDKHVVIKQTVIDAQGLVRVTAYYDGEVLNNTTRYLGNKLNVNDRMSFISHGKWYTYINQITSTNDGIVYYYAKDGSEDKSEVRVHYIDVTGSKNSLFVPGDGEEVATDKISGKLGEKYNYNVNLPTDYNLATNQANTVTGTYTIDHHDEYVYVVKKTSAEKLDPTVPATTKVDNPKKLTDDEKKEVAGKVTEANKDKFPEKTEVTVADDGTVTINYPDGSQDTIPGDQVVEAKKDADKTNPTGPATTKVDNPKKLTDDEKKEVAGKVTEANKDKFPEKTEVTVADDGTVTINYPDGSQDTIPGDQVVEAKKDADKTNPTVPGTKVEVKDPNNLTDEEKQQVKESIENANKGQFPEGTQVTIGNDGTATITYPDGSQDVILGSQLVTKQGSDVANAGDAKNNGQGTTASIQGATADTTAKKLPQTGEQDASATAATGLGLIMLSLLGLFGLGSKKRKED